MNLEDPDRLALLQAQWRFADGLVPGEPNAGLVEQLAESPARLAEYDDSGWEICENIKKGVSKGLSFGWYRIAVTLPGEINGEDVTGKKVWFETCIDDYGELWVDGACDLAFGESGHGAASSFNAPQRVLVSGSAEPGQRHVIACLAINSPLGRPGGGYFMRYARLQFEK